MNISIHLCVFIIYLAIWSCQYNGIAASKFDNKNEIPETGEARKFRIGRVHQVWEKANRMELNSLTMTDLYADLKHLDRLMMEQKKVRADGEDEDGMKEAELTEQLHKTMENYGMTGKVKSSEYLQRKHSKYAASEVFLQDPKLDNLWKIAKKHGKFTQNEMEKLEVEFLHHKRKVEEYEMLKSETSQVDELSDNSVEKQLNKEENEKKRVKMGDMYEDIQEGYQRLHLKTKQGTVTDELVPFTEPRVADLWEAAKKGNFTEEELESIKEELHHFQTRIEKHMFFRDQLKNSVDKVEFHGGKEKAPTESLRNHDHLQSKVQDLAAKVKKLQHDLSSRLSSGVQSHKEL